MTHIKICGLSEPKTLQTAIDQGARFVGFVFYPKSPRNVSINTAFELARTVPTGVRCVGLFVDPDDEQLEHTLNSVQLDLIQLHGKETPQRVAEIKNRFGIPVMKAICIRNQDDLKDVNQYEEIVDWLLFDARPEGATLPGGTGQTFDWNILKDKSFTKPWMLSGGLNADNVKEALTVLKPDAVDISSGVESAPGQKDEAKIKAFINAVKNA